MAAQAPTQQGNLGANSVVTAVLAYRVAHEPQIMNEFVDLRR
jgi:hypothetical protein